MDDDRRRVVDLIRVSFAGVRLGTGIGLREAQGLDDYQTKDVLVERRETDEKDNWSSLVACDLKQCSSSLSFFDPEGMRFHLPAFLVAELEGSVFHCAVFPLIELDQHRRAQLALLSKAQRHAVREFLALLASDPEFEFERPQIEKAIAEYWSR